MSELKDKRGFYKLYPKYNSGMLQVSNIHSIYFEESGNPKGIPVIHFHGGPGYWNKPINRKVFNPKKYRVILFDQRGCGRSKPFGETKDNTTQDLVEDAEKLRKHLKLGKVIASGGSWGSTVVLLYAEKYPKAVSRLLLRSIFLARQRDAEWLVKGNDLALFFPDLWEKRLEAMGKLGLKYLSSKNLLGLLTKGTAAKKKLGVAVIANWEDQFGRLYNKIKLVSPDETGEKDLANGRLFLHFDIHNYFLSENQILKGVVKIKQIPTHIVHGRYDMVCPLYQAWELHKKLPKSSLNIVHLSGHSDNRLSKELVGITDSLIK